MRQVPSTDGVVLAVHDLGGDGPPVLLAHATGFCGRMWEPVVAQLDGHRCWAPDLRAHGDTDTPTGLDLSWWGAAADLLATVDALGLEGCAAAGHSMGAAALLLAELARPGTFARLCCYEPVTAPLLTEEPMQDEVLADLTLRRRETFPSRQAAWDNFVAKPPFDVFAPASLDAYVTHCFEDDPDGPPGAIRLKCRAADESALYRMGRRHGLFERLGEIDCPVTVVTGSPEPGRPSSFAAAVAQRLPRGRLVAHPDLGHFGPQQDPARAAQDITTAWSVR
jgi:pimeloyl-ACP methyl ester carboxylesterase